MQGLCVEERARLGLIFYGNVLGKGCGDDSKHTSITFSVTNYVKHRDFYFLLPFPPDMSQQSAPER